MENYKIVETWNIYETTNYELFKLKEDNRDIRSRNVDKIKDSIVKYGYVRASIIKVGKNFEIIDGQHTYIACKNLGMPIRFAIFKDLTSDDMKALNIAGSNWTTIDFIKYNAENKHTDSIVLLRKIKEASVLNINADKVIYMMFGTKRESAIKSGAFSITNDMLKLYEIRLSNYLKVLEQQDKIVFSNSPNDVVKLFKIIDSNVLTTLLINRINSDDNIRIDLTKKKSEFDYDNYLINLLS